MDLIAEHLPSVGDLREKIKRIVNAECEMKYPLASGNWIYYPRKQSRNTVEFKWCPEELDDFTWSHGNHFGINFMLKCHSAAPRIGDDFYFYLAAWCESEVDNAKARKLHLPGSCSTPSEKLERHWEVLWIGKPYRLRDLGDKDAESLSKLMLDGIHATYTKIRRKVFARFPRKKPKSKIIKG